MGWSPLRGVLRLSDGNTYCVDGLVPGINVFDLPSSFVQECWKGGGAVPMPETSLTSVVAVEVQVPTNRVSTTPFDFCLDAVIFL